MNRPNLSCTLTHTAPRRRPSWRLHQGPVRVGRGAPRTRRRFALSFRGDAATERQVFDFVAMERDCCPFLSFEVRLAAERGAIWLLVRGPSGVKELARGELGRFGLDGESSFAPER